MNFSGLINKVLDDTLNRSLIQFAPELVLSVTVVLLLLGRLFGCDKWIRPYWTAFAGAFIAFGISLLQFAYMQHGSLADSTGFGDRILSSLFELIGLTGQAGENGAFFTGLLIFDDFTAFFRVFLLLFLILVIALTVLSGIPDHEDGPDFYTLFLGATIGMMLMASANNLLIVFLGVEMASVPSYVLVGFLKGRRTSSEASFKFVVYGAGAAGIMLYGISLLAGLLGTADLSMMASRLQLLFPVAEGTDAIAVGMANPEARTVVLAVMMIVVGLMFKLSLVPFHFWCPDAFEGASAEVAGFLSVASKAGAFALLIRICLAFVGTDPGTLSEIGLHFGITLGVIGAITATFGNLAAYVQSNAKRLLAYSTIAHAGYMVMAVAALMVILNGEKPEGFAFDEARQRAIQGLLYYLVVYLFMNLGAFAVVALIRNRIFSEEIDDYAGLSREAPVLCVCMLICMFSLIGLPPMGGFIGKFIIFYSLFEAGAIHWSMWAVLVIAGVNTVFGLFYYIRVLKTMFITPRPEGARSGEVGRNATMYVLLVSAPVLLFGVLPPIMDGLTNTADGIARALFGAIGS